MIGSAANGVMRVVSVREKKQALNPAACARPCTPPPHTQRQQQQQPDLLYSVCQTPPPPMPPQVQIIRSKSDPNYKPPYTTVSACVRSTLRENGFKGPFQVRDTCHMYVHFFRMFDVLRVDTFTAGGYYSPHTDYTHVHGEAWQQLSLLCAVHVLLPSCGAPGPTHRCLVPAGAAGADRAWAPRCCATLPQMRCTWGPLKCSRDRRQSGWGARCGAFVRVCFWGGWGGAALDQHMRVAAAALGLCTRHETRGRLCSCLHGASGGAV